MRISIPAARPASPAPVRAFQRQIDVLGSFIGANARPDAAMLVAGNFDVGPDGARRRYFADRLLADPPR